MHSVAVLLDAVHTGEVERIWRELQDRFRVHGVLARPRSPWRRVDPVPAENRPDGGGSDLVAPPRQLAVDAPVAPLRVLSGQTDDEPGEGSRGRRASSPGAPIGPPTRHQPPVPGQ